MVQLAVAKVDLVFNPRKDHGFSSNDLTRFYDKIDWLLTTDKGCLLWIGSKKESKYGEYGIFSLKGRNISAHRFSYRLFVGEITKTCVCYYCDAPSCVNPFHLFLGTKQDNSDDMVAKDRQPKGVNKPLARLTETQVREIKILRKNGYTLRTVADMFDVCFKTIHKIDQGTMWSHVV